MRTDKAVKETILEEFDWDPEIESSDIGVIVRDGVATLKGTVSNYLQKAAADRAVKRVAGVRVLINELEVKLSPAQEMSDEKIARHIANVLEWNVALPHCDIKAEVHNGVVTLTGEVDWRYQIEGVKSHIEYIRGVRTVYDSVVVRKRTSTKDVRREIVRALHRNADVEASKIEVAVSDGTVTLSGDVRALYEKETIEHAAWAAPGVSAVVDKLRIA